MDDISGLPPEEAEGDKPEAILPKKKALDVRVPPPLPATRADLEAQRKVADERTINSYVDEIHGHLWDDPEYQKFFKAIYPPQAVEGALFTDHEEAARMVRQYARDNEGYLLVKDEKVHTIALALNVVRRRLRIDVNYRRNMIDGVTVPNGEEQPEE